jgi:hypothetical protein
MGEVIELFQGRSSMPTMDTDALLDLIKRVSAERRAAHGEGEDIYDRVFRMHREREAERKAELVKQFEAIWNDPEIQKMLRQRQQTGEEIAKLHSAGKIGVSGGVKEAEDAKLDEAFGKLDKALGQDLMALEREAQGAGFSVLRQRKDPAPPPASVLLAKRAPSTAARKRKRWRMTSKGTMVRSR